MNERSGTYTVVLGLGNPLLTDDGLGIAAIERLSAGWDLPPEIEVIDGGTWGMTLLVSIEEADQLILVDAIDAGREPGDPITLERDELPRLLHMKLSPHQVDLRDALAVAELRGKLTDRVVALGIQPAELKLGTQLSALLESRVDGLAERVVERLELWGHACRRKQVGVA